MKRPRQLALIASAAVAAGVGFALARPGGNEDDRTAARAIETEAASTPAPVAATGSAPEEVDTGDEAETGAEPTETASADTAPAETTPGETGPGETAPPETGPSEAEPKLLTVRVRGGKPVGGVRTLAVKKGETVRFAVTSDLAEEVHVHGYDLTKEVGPGAPARFRFRADIEGIFEVELEGAHEPILELRVEP